MRHISIKVRMTIWFTVVMVVIRMGRILVTPASSMASRRSTPS